MGGVRLVTLPLVRGPGPVRSRAPSRPPEGVTLPCVGRPTEWESDDANVIAQARAVCAECAGREWCEREARHAVEDGLEISGVWHGEIYPRTLAAVGST